MQEIEIEGDAPRRRSARRRDERQLAIGIDIGGTKVAAGVVDRTGNILDRVRRDTPTSKSPEGVEDTIAEIVDELWRRPGTT